MKITRRLLALLLAMCMLFGNVATPAMAAEFAETEPAEIQEEIIDQPEIEEEPEESADEAEETTESEEVVEEAEEETTESEEPADEAEEELAAFDEVADEAAYYDATGAEDAEISAEGILFAYVAEADGILTISISGNPGYRVVVMDSELNPIGLPEENSEAKDLTYAVQGGETYTVSIFGFDPAEQSAVDAVITYSLSFAEDTTESEEPAEYAIDCEITLIPGENALTLLADAVTTVYSFLPEEAGVYTFTADNADALVGYWGADSSDVSDITETKTNALEVAIAEVGQCAMIGISGVESCALTVEKTGDVNGTAEEQVNGEPVGTLNNPALLEETLQTIHVADNAYFCTWTADEAGTFTFAIDESCTDWRYGIDNLTTGVIGTVYNSTDEIQTPSQQIPVAAGDQLMICVGLASGEPGDVTFSASFLPAPGSEGNPIAIVDTAFNAEVPAGDTVYYSGMPGEMIFTLTGENVTVFNCTGSDSEEASESNTYESINGVVTFAVACADTCEPWTLAITNNSDADAVYPITLTSSEAAAQMKGLESNPYSFDPEWGDATWNDAMTEAVITAVVPADTTVYFDASMMSGCMYSIDGGKLQMLPTEDGTGIIPYVNDSDEEKEVTVRLVIPVGHYYNPAKLTKLGATTVNLAAGSDGYHYEWTAEEDGYFTFTVTSKATAKLGWMYALEYENMPRDTGAFWSDDEVVTPGQTLYLYAGETVIMYVNTYLPDAMSPKGAVKFQTTFTPGVYRIASGKSQNLTLIDPNTGKAIAAGQLDWTIDACQVYTPDGDYVDFEDIASYATLKNGTLKTLKCGDSVLLSITAVNKKDPTITASYDVEILPASTKLAMGYYRDGAWIPVVGDWWWNVSQAQIDWEIENYGKYEDWWFMEAYSYPDNSKQEVKWTSSNSKLVSVDENGKLQLVIDPKTGTYKAGTVTITATTTDGSNKKASFKLTLKKVSSFVEISRNDGVALEELDTWYYDEEGNRVDETHRVVYADAGTKVNLVATTDADVTTKGFNWYSYSDYGKVSNGTVTINKNTPDNTWIWIGAESKDYEAYDEIVIIVSNKAPSVDAQYEDRDEYNVGWNGNVVDMDISDATEYDLPYVIIRGWENAGEDYVQDIENWTLSSKIASLEFIYFWGDENYKRFDMENMPAGATVYTMVKVTPVWTPGKGCSTGSVTLTGTSADGKLKTTFKINLVSQVNYLDIYAKDGENMFWAGEEEFFNPFVNWNQNTQSYDGAYHEGFYITATAGQSVTLVGEVNANAKNKKLNWYAECPAFPDAAKISNGKLTIAKDVPAETVIWVCAQTTDGSWIESWVPVVVTPLATNVHVRAHMDDSIKYVSNATVDWDVNTHGRTLHLSSLVYPFDASQSVTFTVNNKAIAEVIAGSDNSAILIFTGTKYGKLTVTATANDGSKEKTTFTLNVYASAVKLGMKDGTADYVAAGKTLDLSKQVLINADPTIYVPATNQKLTWSFSEDTKAAADAIKAKITNGKLTTDVKLAAKAGITELSVVVNSADGYGKAKPLTWNVTVYPATNKVFIENTVTGEINKPATVISGYTLQLKAFTDVVGAYDDYTWTSSNAKVATVDPETGLVTAHAVKDGKATIKATATDGTGTSASITVNVKANATELKLADQVTTSGKTLNLAKLVKFYDEDGCEITPTNKTITWTLYELAPMKDADGNYMFTDDGHQIYDWVEVAKNAQGVSENAAVKLTAAGSFTAKTVTEPARLAVKGIYVNTAGDTIETDQVGVQIYPKAATAVRVGACLGEFDQYAMTDVTGMKLTTDKKQAVLDAYPVCNGIACYEFEYVLDNDAFEIEYQKFEIVSDYDGQVYYNLLPVLKAVDEANPYGTVKVTVKTIDGSNKSASVTITFAEPEWTEPIP